MSARPTPLLRLEGITKRFGALVANDAVDLDLHTGEVLALLGENGAGKSTLMNMVYGMYRPDGGQIHVRGEKVSIDNPGVAMRLGIGMVHQHFMLVPGFTVAENVVLGSPRRHGPLLRRTAVNAEVAALAADHGIAVDVTRRVEDLTVEQQQQVEILKALYRGAEILILDEPTAVLGPIEVERLFRTVRGLCERGCTVVIITHKLGEVLEVADRIAVLRRGALVADQPKVGLDRESLSVAMLGRDLPTLPERPTSRHARERVLEVRGLGYAGTGEDERSVEAVDLDVCAGEIVGVTGVEGNGQTELMRMLSGLLEPSSGTVSFRGDDITTSGPRERWRRKIALISDDRHRWDVVDAMNLQENLALVGIGVGEFGRGLLRPARMRRHATRLLADYGVSPADPHAPMSSLSGGNQQRVVLARELSRDPELVVAAHPTRGLDVGASDFVFRQLMSIRDNGGAVVLSSGDLDELWAVCDRVVVMYRGRKVLDERVDLLDVDTVARAMADGGAREGAVA